MRPLPAVLSLAALLAAPLAGRAAASDPRAGERLFLGETPLANGGAPCLACHALAGHGLAWHASFGPDLSGASASFDADALAGILEDVPFPSMAPLYRDHAITPGERADLVAFLLETRAATPATAGTGTLALRAGAVALLILGALALLARRRMPPVRDALRARAAKGGTR